MIAVPAVVRNKAIVAGATAWLDDLSLLVDGIERDWELRLGRVFPDAEELVEVDVQDPGGRNFTSTHLTNHATPAVDVPAAELV